MSLNHLFSKHSIKAPQNGDFEVIYFSFVIIVCTELSGLPSNVCYVLH